MKALVVSSGHELDLREIRPPVPGPYEALVRIIACGICSTTDRELIKGTQPYNDRYPCVLGHEAVGEVVESGVQAKTFKKGDLVTRPAAIYPGESRDGLASAWGGFAEFGIVRDRLAMMADGDRSLENDYTAMRQVAVPAGTDIGHAVLAISLAETSSWFRHLPQIAGKNACVSGTGIAGLSIALWCKLAGAAKIVVLGRRKERLDLERELGADHGVNVKESDPTAVVRDLTGGGADLFIEASGGKGQVKLGLSLVKPGGTMAIYGVPEGGKYDGMDGIPSNVRLVTPPAEEHLAYGSALDLLRRGVVPDGRLLTHRWPLTAYAEAFDAIERGVVVKGMLVM
jgi:threonine dehydrogenase-like Zn-dependent dehydrogenase